MPVRVQNRNIKVKRKLKTRKLLSDEAAHAFQYQILTTETDFLRETYSFSTHMAVHELMSDSRC